MLLSDFDYHLPAESIAQQALEDRAASRMLVVHRAAATWDDCMFRDLPRFLRTGDCLVLNDSKVIPARLFGHRAGARALAIGRHNPKLHEHLGGEVEVLLANPVGEDPLVWLVLARPGRKLRIGELIRFSDKLSAEIIGHGEYGERTVRFHCDGDFYEAIAEVGHVPLPPYIHRDDTDSDRGRYQTVFAEQPGSVAAPTAGLHFTPEVLASCEAAGATVARVTLHVGLGTFQPLRTEVVEEAKLHGERFRMPPDSAERIRNARRVIAVGTTSVRTVETVAASAWSRCSGETDLFIYPGYEFRRVNAILTNFHLPQSSLLVLVCAFGGRELILAAYQHAVEAGYRFYSYGDCMLIL